MHSISFLSRQGRFVHILKLLDFTVLPRFVLYFIVIVIHTIDFKSRFHDQRYPRNFKKISISPGYPIPMGSLNKF